MRCIENTLAAVYGNKGEVFRVDIKEYPLPTILVILGAIFFLIALLPKIHTKWGNVEAKGIPGRVLLGLIGASLVSVGIYIHVFESGGIRPHDHQVNVPEEPNAKPAPGDDPCGPSSSAVGTMEPSLKILSGAVLTNGFGIGVAGSGDRGDWLKLNTKGGCFTVEYPDGQSWGAAFVTVGEPNKIPRPSRDFSRFRTLVVEMKSGEKPETIEIGVKSAKQPDTGSESKVAVNVTPEWKPYAIPLNQFVGTNLKELWTVTEFVFTGSQRKTVRFRSIEYLGDTN